MKKLTLLSAMLVFLFISNKSYSQDWLPSPVKSQYIDALVGTWTSDPYEFMGSTATEVMTYDMILNGQFLEMNFKSTDNKNGFTYSGKEILVPASDGGMQGTYYDILGKEKVTSYTGKMDGTKFILTSTSPTNTGINEIIVDGNTMTSNTSFMMPDKSGNHEMKISKTYKKTN